MSWLYDVPEQEHERKWETNINGGEQSNNYRSNRSGDVNIHEVELFLLRRKRKWSLKVLNRESGNYALEILSKDPGTCPYRCKMLVTEIKKWMGGMTARLFEKS